MRQLPASLAASLASGATTLARAWRLTRRDGTVLGFTDHDRDLVFDAITHRAVTAFEASEMTVTAGLNVDASEVSGALVAPGLEEGDLAAGIYDAATVEQWVVDWTNVADRVLMSVGVVGEVTREGPAFKAEVRSRTHVLAQEQGRLTASLCDARFGDHRCKADASGAGRKVLGSVAGVDGPRVLIPSGVGAIAEGMLSRGTLRVMSGAGLGLSFDIALDQGLGALRRLTLWQVPMKPLAAGDQIELVVGCDKRFATCRDVFSNAVNFRGFPHLPGIEQVLGYARTGANNDGGSLNQ